MNELVKKIKHQCMALKNDRSTYESQWNEIAKYISPRSTSFNITETTGRKLYENVWDSTPLMAARERAAGLQGFLTSPTEKWFELNFTSPVLQQNKQLNELLEITTQTMYDVMQLPQTNFYSAAHEMYQELVAFGTGVMLIEESDESIVSFKSIALSQCYISENHNNEIDTLYRIFSLTPRNILSMFPNLEEEVRNKLLDKVKGITSDNETNKIEVIHAVYPREKYDTETYNVNNKKFASVYVLPSFDCVAKEGGFNEFPYVVARWTKRANEIYGRGPGEEVLPDVKVLNNIVETTILAGQLAVRPPLQLPDDGVIDTPDLSPGALNYLRTFGMDGQEIKPINLGGDVALGLEMENRRRDQIARGFYTDLMQEQKQKEMTASEYLGREEARMRILAPQVGRLQSEYLEKLIERTFNICLRKGVFNLPQEFASAEYRVHYVSPLARAQKMSQAAQVTRLLEQLGQIAQIFPNVIQVIDQDKLAQYMLDLHSTPKSLIKTEEEVLQERQAQQQLMQQQQQLMAAESMSKSAANVGSAVSSLGNVANETQQ